MSIGYSSTIRPGRLDSRITRSPRRTASRTLWVTKMTVRPGLAPEPLELVVQHVAGHRVERAERLVHEEHVGLLGERTGERDPLAHAAGQLVRQLVAEGCRGSRGRAARSALRVALRAWSLRILSGSSTLPRAVSHGKSADSWNISVVRASPVSTVPALGRSRPATMLSSVLFPQPDAPSRQTNSPGATLSVMLSSACTELPSVPNTLETWSMRQRDARGVLDRWGGRGRPRPPCGSVRSVTVFGLAAPWAPWPPSGPC